MSAVLEHFYRTTAINSWDLGAGSMRSNPVSVTYSPVDIQNYTPRLVGVKSDSARQDDYIKKALEFTKEQLSELSTFIDISEQAIIDVVNDSLKSGYKHLEKTGHTVGAMFEVTAVAGLGVVAGMFFAFDKTGFSVIGFAGAAAGAALEVTGIVGGFYYEGPREGLEGFGGEFSASIGLGPAIEWEAMFTGGNTGHVVAGGLGVGFALSIEFQHAWLIREGFFNGR